MPHDPLQFPCQGRQVIAVLVSQNGRVYVGSNGIERQDGGCPRVSAGFGRGMGWELCKTVCGQTGHAEDVVLQDAGDDASGSTLYLIGHDTVCERCKELINSAGVAHLVIVG